jgi:hypothetical protein
MNIIEVEPGVYSVIQDGNSWEVRVSGDEITIGDHRLLHEPDDPRQWKRSGHNADAHGHVSIKAAQGIMVVEAMKMQNELRAPRAGKVTSVSVKENDSVIAGAVLVSIE